MWQRKCSEYLRLFRAFQVQNSSRWSNLKALMKKSNYGEKHDQCCGSSPNVYCTCVHVNQGFLVHVGKRNESYVIWQYRNLQNFETNMFWFGTASSIVVHLLGTWSVFVCRWNTIQCDLFSYIQGGWVGGLIYGSPPSPPWSLSRF